MESKGNLKTKLRERKMPQRKNWHPGRRAKSFTNIQWRAVLLKVKISFLARA